jgi:hypothetical protein
VPATSIDSPLRSFTNTSTVAPFATNVCAPNARHTRRADLSPCRQRRRYRDVARHLRKRLSLARAKLTSGALGSASGRIIESVAIGEQHEHVRFNEVGDECTQRRCRWRISSVATVSFR